MVALTDIDESMTKTIDAVKNNFSAIRTGRANPALLKDIKVSYYGALTPLNQLASINVSGSRTLVVSVFDASQVTAVEKAIRDSDLGVNPNRDGNTVHITLPELTEDRRKDYVKLAKEKGEEGKVSIRNIRRKARETAEKELKDNEISEDDKNHFFKELDTITKKYSDQIDELLAIKEQEILSI